MIHRNAQAQGKIIEDILDVARIITGKLRLDLGPADLAVVVRSAIEVVQPSALAKGITVQFPPPAEALPSSRDPDRMQQVVWNLLSNAMKFSRSGRQRGGHSGAGRLESLAHCGGHRQGIEPEFLPYVFDRFKQADSSTTRKSVGWGSVWRSYATSSSCTGGKSV